MSVVGVGVSCTNHVSAVLTLIPCIQRIAQVVCCFVEIVTVVGTKSWQKNLQTKTMSNKKIVFVALAINQLCTNVNTGGSYRSLPLHMRDLL